MLNTLLYKCTSKNAFALSGYIKLFSTASEAKLADKIEIFRTNEDDPTKHTENHIGQYYTVNPDIKKQLFTHGGLTKSFITQTKTFTETCIMVRKPAVDVINCLRNIDLSKPCTKFVLYGKKGFGKSISLAHILHYGLNAGYLIVHVPWVGNWMRRCKEKSDSETREGFTDLNLDAADWLQHFKTQNAHLLNDPAFLLSEEIAWSKREMTPKGSSFLDLIDHGTNRIKYASECVVVLAREIKKLAKQGACKVLIAVDGYNAFFYPKTRILTEKKEIVHPQKVTLSIAFTELTQTDWNNAVAVLTVDELAIAQEDHISHLPRYNRMWKHY